MAKNKKKAFTLIEIIVAITITSMILVSIVEIFIFSGIFAKKIDSSRIMQENIKNFIQIISEDIRINGINNLPNNTNIFNKNSNILITGTGTGKIEYYLAIKNGPNYTEISNKKCKKLKKENRCILVRKKSEEIEELVNSHISFEKLSFDISGGKKSIPKVTINFVVRPALGKGLGVEKIKNAKIIMQTTISERIYKYK